MNFLLLAVILLAPLYVWRFNILGLPANFLLVAMGLVTTVYLLWLIQKRQVANFVQTIKAINVTVWKLIVIFFVASLISLFVGGLNASNLGQWLVLYLLPLTFGAILYYQNLTNPKFFAYLITGLYLFVAIAGSLAIVQYLTLWEVPESWWGNAAEPRPAISFFAHPNAFALYLTPLLAFLFANVVEKISDWRNQWGWILLWCLGAVGLFLSLSRGAWLALAASIFLYAIVKASKKTLLSASVALLILTTVVFAIPNFRYRILLPFHGEKSTVARFSLWDTGWKMVQDSPVLGKGVNGFSDNWEKFNVDPNLEHYNFPHNIFLNFWVDSGLLGLLSFLSLNLWLCYLAFKNRKRHWVNIGLILFIAAIFTHGLIDIPYFKNDLALIYWVIIFTSIFTTTSNLQNNEKNI